MSIRQEAEFGIGREKGKELSNFSKKTAKALVRASKMCSHAFTEMHGRNISRGVFNRLAREYNQSAKLYNSLRQRLLVNSVENTRGIYGIQEKLQEVAAKMQSIGDTLKASPRIPQRDYELNRKPIAPEPKPINWGRVGLLGSAALLTVILPACAAAEVIQIPGEEEPAPTVESETTEATPIVPENPVKEVTEEPEIKPTPTVSVDIGNIPSDLNEFETQEVKNVMDNFALAMEEGFNNNQSLKDIIGDQTVVIYPDRFYVKGDAIVYLTEEGGPLGDAAMTIGKNNELLVLTFGGGKEILGVDINKETHYWDFWSENGKTIILVREKGTGKIVACTDQDNQWAKAEDVDFIGKIKESWIVTAENAIDASREDIEVAWEDMNEEQRMQTSISEKEKLGVEDAVAYVYDQEAGVIRTEDGREIECAYDIDKVWAGEVDEYVGMFNEELQPVENNYGSEIELKKDMFL